MSENKINCKKKKRIVILKIIILLIIFLAISLLLSFGFDMFINKFKDNKNMLMITFIIKMIGYIMGYSLYFLKVKNMLDEYNFFKLKENMDKLNEIEKSDKESKL